jgi:hypothetical protein
MGKFAACLAISATIAARMFGAADDAAIQSTFVKPWIEALRSKDAAKIQRFYHPQVLACANAATKQYFDSILDREANSAVAGAYHVTRIAPLKGPPPAFLPEDSFSYPVQPTYEVQIQFDQSDVVFIRYLAPANGNWFEVFPCPNEKGVAFVRKQIADGIEQQKRSNQLVSELKEPLLSELKALLAQQRKLEAVKKYQAASGVDLTTAVTVIKALERSGR